jgi:medium-chain acyl-[acyl-carrier-protein] hydrolase
LRYSEKMQLPFYFATENGTVSLANVVNLVQRVSENQLAHLGEGMEALTSHGIGWIITQSQLEFTRALRAEEDVTVWTEARSYNRLLCYRDYGIDAADGTPIVRVSSTWAMMDLQKRRIIPVVEAAMAGIGAVADSKVKRLPRLAKMGTPTGHQEYRVRYFDIDGNHHVNNVHYLDWMLDPLGDEFLNTHTPKTVNIKYAREVERDSQVLSEYAWQTEAHTQSLHQISVAGSSNAEAEITWQEV